MNWLKNANFRKKFLFAFGVLSSFIAILAILGIVTIRNVESAFTKLSDGPNQRLVYASEAVAEFANCRRCVLAIGYMTHDAEYVDLSYENFKLSANLVLAYLDAYYYNFINDPSLPDHEKESRKALITDIKEVFAGPYLQNVDEVYKAALADDRQLVDELRDSGMPMGDEMTVMLRNLRSMVQYHLDEITTATHSNAYGAIKLLIISAILLILLSVLVSVFMSNILRAPLVHMKNSMAEISKGNLHYPIRSAYTDELGMLSNQIGDMVDTISMLNKAVAIVDNVNELIFVTDLAYNLIFTNRRVSEVFEFDRDTCVGHKCYEVIFGKTDGPCSFCPLPNLISQKNSLPSCDWEHLLKINGEDVWFACKTSIIRWVDGSLVQIFTCKDDTLRKMHEKQQQRHAEELRKAALAAEAASRAKSTFLASMSHEIRTPMNAVMGMSELILRKDLPQDVFENALTIKVASQNLLSIINDILDLSKIESGKLELTESEYELASLIYDIISIIRIRIIEKPILFTVDIDSRLPALLIGDEIRIRQTLLNILGNAAKYTEKGCISLSVSGVVSGDSVTLTIDISDTGIGIKEEDIDSLFGEFVQVDAERNKGVEGTGLGLPIALKLCEAMGGTITVQSEYGKGSTFTITLSQKVNEYRPFAVVDSAADKLVLLYESRHLYRDSIERAFKELGVNYEIADDLSDLLRDLGKYTHLFISLSVFERIHTELLKLSRPPKLAVLTEVTESLMHKSARVLDLPAYSLSVANILNDIYEERDGLTVMKDSFTAPGVNVLIVDDMASNLMVAKGLMAPYEMNITTCVSGAEAVRLVADNHYDLIFMDHMMPEMDGLEATAQIREMDGEYFKTVPIIALTANAISGVREMFIQHGMNDFLAKPIETTKLNAILMKWIPSDKRSKIKPADQPPKPPASTSFLINNLSGVPGLSAVEALSVMGGAAETYEDIFKLSIRLLPENIENLTAFLDGDSKDYAIAVHGIKGVLNNIGAYEIGKLAQELENLSKSGDMEACRLLHQPFVMKLSKFLNNVNAIINQIEAPEKMDGEKAKLLEDLKNLEEAAEFFNASNALDILAETCKYTYGQKLDELITALKNAFEAFDFDKAAQLLEILKEELG